MLPEDFSVLELSRYELRLQAQGAAALPPFLGSTLRGAFGHALKGAVCVMSHRNCSRCMVADRCIYPYLFETPAPTGLSQLRGQQQAPHPFILTPPVPSNPFRKVWKLNNPTRTPSNTPPNTVERATPKVTISDSSQQRRHFVAGDDLTFRLVLMGRAAEYLPYIVYTVTEMARQGLGADRARFKLSEVTSIDESGAITPIYNGQSQGISGCGAATGSLRDLVSVRLEQLPNDNSVKLRFLTPTRIRVDSDLQLGLSFELLVRNLLRRISLLTAVHAGAQLELDYRNLIAQAAGVKTASAQLCWWDLERYSNRQKTKMNMGGFIGEIEYQGEAIRDFMPLLAAGEVLHVGGGTSFGLGKYQIVT